MRKYFADYVKSSTFDTVEQQKALRHSHHLLAGPANAT